MDQVDYTRIIHITSVQQAFDLLRSKIGHRAAIELMDTIEGDSDAYQKIVKALETNTFDLLYLNKKE